MPKTISAPPSQPATEKAPVREVRQTAQGPLKASWRMPRISALDVVLGAALCLLIAIGFYPATLGGFVWDDAAFTMVKPVQEPSGILRIWFDPRTLIHEGHYWPILYTLFWLEHKIWGFDNPVYYHVLNLILHAGVVVVLWRLLLRLEVGRAWVAWVAAAIFALHPLHVESVAWVIGRKDMLAALFYLASVLAYLRFMDRGRGRHYGWSLALYVLGLLCKSIGVTLPAALLIWHWWKRGRVTSVDVGRMLPFLLLGLFITIADWAEYKSKEVISFDFSTLERMLLAAQALWFYVGQLVWPTKLMIIYPRWDISIANLLGWVYLIGIVAVAALLWLYRGKIGRGALAGVLFFVVTLSPTLGFVDYGYMQFAFVADRYQYLAGAGVIVVLVAAVAWIYDRGLALWPGVWMRRGGQVVAAVLPAAVLGVLGMITWNQAGVYFDQGTLYNHIISQNPKARGAHHSLGHWHQRHGRIEEALANYRIAIQKRPDHAAVFNKIGTAYETMGRLEEAEQNYRRSVEINPRLQHPVTNLALLLAKQGRFDESVKWFRTVLRVHPDFVNAHNGLGIALHGLGRIEEALRSFNRALELDPNLPDARQNRDHMLQLLQSQAQAK